MIKELTLEIPFEYEHHQWCIRDALINCKAKIICLLGGIGSGKTTTGSMLSLELALSDSPGCTGMIVVPSYKTYKQVTLPEIQKWWPGEGTLWESTMAGGFPSIIVKTSNGPSTIFVRSAQDARTIEDIRGATLAWVWGDEVASWTNGNGRMAFDLILGRLRQKSPTGKMTRFLMTGTPRWGWLQEVLNVGGSLPPQAWTTGIYTGGDEPWSRTYIFSAPTEKNTHNEEFYSKSLRLKYGERFAKQELDGDFCPPENAVYPNFYPQIHVVKHNISMQLLATAKYIVGGVDWGWGDPAALVLAGILNDSRVIIFKEYTQPGKTVEQLAIVANSWASQYNINAWYVPPDDPGAAQKWRGLAPGCPPVQGVMNANNQVEAGIDTIQTCMRLSTSVPHASGDPNVPGTWFYVSEQCPTLSKNLQELIRRPTREGGLSDKFKGLDHLPDALRYALHTALRVNITRSR
jgi:hypothetical protein